MTSCDRLALQLALTHLRDADTDHGLTWAYCALTCGGERSAAIIAALDAITRARDPVDNRVLRARLALAIRALLRAAGGDIYSLECDACATGRQVPRLEIGGLFVLRCTHCHDLFVVASLGIVPLWQQGARKAGAA